jgi:POT family proton-dependent oligopeptide transporter
MQNLNEKKTSVWKIFDNEAKFLFLIQVFSVITFSVISYSLAQLVTISLNASEYFATQLTATYIALNFILHLLAGVLINNFTTAKKLLLTSLILSIIGCIIMAYKSSLNIFSYGLAMQLCGNGLSITCINSLLNKKSNPKNKNQFFLYNYGSMNIGFLIGFLLSGYYDFNNNYKELFFLCIIFNVIALIITPLIKSKDTINYRTFFIPLIFTILVQFILKQSYFSNQMLLPSLILTIIVIIYKNKKAIDDNNIQKIILLFSSGLVFWSIYYLTPITLMFFIKNYINNNIFDTIISPQWYEVINSSIIILGSPILANTLLKKSNKYNFQKLFALAIGLSSIGILLLLIGIHITPAGSKISSIWIIMKIILESLGELILSPIGIVMAIKLLGKKASNLAIGSWLMLNGAAASLSGLLIKIISSTHNTPLALFNLGYYNRILFLALTIGVVCCFTLIVTNLSISNKFKI